MPAVFLFAAGCAATRTPAKEAQNLFDRGRVYARQGDNDLAIAYYNRAVAYYQIGDYARAWYDLHKAYQLGTQPDPEFVKKLRKATGTAA